VRRKRVESSRKLRESLREAIYQRKEERGAKTRLKKFYVESKEEVRNADKFRREVSDFLSNVKHELTLSGINARYSVVKNKDLTIDAELRVPYPDTVEDVDDATDVLNQVEEALDRIPHMQFISVGFSLNQKANEEGVRASALQYVKYEGELRLNPNFYDTSTGQPVAFQVAYEVLRNITKAHGMLPTGMLIRFAWSPSGWLMRKNDTDLRKPANKLAPSKPGEKTSKVKRKTAKPLAKPRKKKRIED
jgi:hypothetical protein